MEKLVFAAASEEKAQKYIFLFFNNTQTLDEILL